MERARNKQSGENTNTFQITKGNVIFKIRFCAEILKNYKKNFCPFLKDFKLIAPRR